MAYLVMFHWGWLLASLLLGLAMGWISVVHRGRVVSRPMAWWLAGLAAALVAAALAHLIPGRPGQSHAEHTAIVDAVIAGDAEKAERAMRKHLDNVAHALERSQHG